jgi:Mg-chelatase subunit ChlD
VLDISGSMGSGLTSNGEGHRLELAKEAILMFVSKLRAGDSFGLVVFNNTAKTLIPSQTVSEI